MSRPPPRTQPRPWHRAGSRGLPKLRPRPPLRARASSPARCFLSSDARPLLGPCRAALNDSPGLVLFATLGLLGLAGFAIVTYMQGERRRREEGRWVRDRSLGGKMVWVSDQGSAAPKYRSLAQDMEELAGTASTTASTAASAATATSR